MQWIPTSSSRTRRELLSLSPYLRIEASGDIYWFASVLTPFYDEYISCNLLLVIQWDITEIKRKVIELQQEEKDANPEKTDLISLLSGNITRAATIVSKFLLLPGIELCKPACFSLNQSHRGIGRVFFNQNFGLFSSVIRA